MLIAILTEYFLCLDDFGSQAVTVADRVLADACLNELWRDSELAKVPLLLLRVSSELP